ncbi:glycerol-3-phosphate 1-O-acyltransferase PlsY [Streptococcus moroccensis]|uniref:Glycerol-3-phosphate acyltransferase n=1 Tax=Streptococcus moroccensis TaxID=1451356 RepID=A0ABT9YQ52_9STRE|nr:glycerol-3-phosphate 1-O-acyltransferase PlsY [Streptococcus moroccensis]MDQ0221707.1 glycerol-3-phosphate acyltransferase PlsY [Streptococcus moroccensis]
MTILFLLIAYLLGSIPSGLWIGQVFYKKNLRAYGSGNTGTTNTFRILGKKAGIIVFLLDFFKGTLAVLLPIWFGVTDVSPLIFGMMAVIGHTFPVFAQFKGGKAVATSAGMLFGYNPIYCIILLSIFAGCLYLTSMISFSSVVAAATAIVTVIILPQLGILLPKDWILLLVVLIVASIVIIRHRDNIQRIKRKKENLIPWGLNLTKQKPLKK